MVEQFEAVEPDTELPHRKQPKCGDIVGSIYERHAQALFLFAQSLTRDPDLAEDLVQQTFLRALAFDPATLREGYKPLLFAILRNLIRDHRRRVSVVMKGYPLLQSDAARTEAAGEMLTAEELERLSQALSCISDEQREAVILKVHAELTYAQMSSVLGIPEAAARSRYRAALEKLARLLSDQGECA
jgi:RNA polymerase sigma-70 factor (ECF subfamily)